MKSRFRIFAGPNGSGKSTLFDYLRKTKNIHTEIYVSADRIESELLEKSTFTFNAYRISTSEEEFFEYVKSHGLWKNAEQSDPGNWFSLKGGILKVNKKYINSYSASFIAGYLIEKLIITGQSFCFETVMSHESKLDLIKKAKQHGYKTYLYYVFTRIVDLNIERIKLRVKTGGHDVPEEKVKERYKRSMGLLLSAINLFDAAFVIDNTYNDFTISGGKKDESIFWTDSELPYFFSEFSKG